MDDVTENKDKSDKAANVELKRELGLVGATSMLIGSIIGSGIFISPKGVLQNTGSVGLCLIIWVLAGVASLGSALCYAELGTTIQKSGGSYTYMRMGLGNPIAFVYALTMVFVRFPGGLVVVLLTFSRYTVTLLPTCGSPTHLEKFIAAAILVSLFLANSYSSRWSATVTIVTTIGKLSALLVIIIGGIVAIGHGTVSELGTGFSGTTSEPSSLALAFYSASWATGGGENLNALVEEIKNPSKNLPRAAIFGVLVVIGVYTLTNVSYLAVMSRAELVNAKAVAVVFGERVLGPATVVIPLAVMVSTLGTANNGILCGSRVTFCAARDGNLPDILSYIQVHRLTPLSAMTVTAAMALIFLLPGDIEMLINYLSFLMSFFNMCVFLAMLRFRLWTMKHARRILTVPLVIPVLMVLLNLYLFIAPLVIKPRLEYVYVASGLFGGGLFLYVTLIHFRLTLPFYGKLVTWTQLILEVCPSAKSVE